MDNILHFEKTGKGPVVVLLHGYLCSLRYWDSLKQSLESDHTVITIDLLGFGESPKPKSIRYGYSDHVEWIKRTLDFCKIDEPVMLAGHSMGALLALRYSFVYPESVRRLLLVNIPVFKDANEARHELASTNLIFRAGLYWELHRLICPMMRTSPMQGLMRKFMPQQYLGMETYMFSSSAEARSRSLRNVIESQKSITELEEIGIPVTIIAGENERPMYLYNLKSLRPSNNLKILITNTGHHTPIENPELVLSLSKA